MLDLESKRQGRLARVSASVIREKIRQGEMGGGWLVGRCILVAACSLRGMVVGRYGTAKHCGICLSRSHYWL